VPEGVFLLFFILGVLCVESLLDALQVKLQVALHRRVHPLALSRIRGIRGEGSEMLLVEPVVCLRGSRVAYFDPELRAPFLLYLELAVALCALVDVFIVTAALLFPVADIRHECRVELVISHNLAFIGLGLTWGRFIGGGLRCAAVDGFLADAKDSEGTGCAGCDNLLFFRRFYFFLYRLTSLLALSPLPHHSFSK
jgi:hypothetical protein